MVVSDDVFNLRSGTVIAMAVTSESQRAGFPLTLELAEGTLPNLRASPLAKILGTDTHPRHLQVVGDSRFGVISVADLFSGRATKRRQSRARRRVDL